LVTGVWVIQSEDLDIDLTLREEELLRSATPSADGEFVREWR
jgi:hypothetical protein